MIALFKAVPIGGFLTLTVALFVGSAGSGGGALDVFGFEVDGTRFYWSWPIFCLSGAIAWGMLLLIGD